MAKDFDITTVAGRKKLAPRTNPYYRREGAGHLGFRCTGADGEGTWIGRATEAGKYITKPLGRHNDYATALEAYEKWADEVVHAQMAGVSKKARGMTVGDAAAHYLTYLDNTRADENAVKKARAALQRFLIGRDESSFAKKGRKIFYPVNPLVHVRLADLTRAHMMELRTSTLQGIKEAKATRAQKATAARSWVQLVAMFNRARKDGLISSDLAWAGIEGFGNTQATHTESYRYLERKERADIIKRIGEEFDDEGKAYVELLCYFGPRPIELERLKVSDYDKKRGTLRLWGYKGKGSQLRERTVPVGVIHGAAATLDRITRNKLPNAPIFNIDQNRRQKIMTTVCDGLKINDASAYCFRHSFITDCLSARPAVPVMEVARICGTSVVMIERTYAKLLVENVERAFKDLRFA